MGNRIYGCDDCLAACPWNRFARAAEANAAFASRDDLDGPALADLLSLEDAAFRAKFSGSPIKRIGVDRFLRNCLIAAGNSGSKGLRGPVERHLEHPNPVVADAARWALARLA
jgi:epoxyqueuosine reductase